MNTQKSALRILLDATLVGNKEIAQEMLKNGVSPKEKATTGEYKGMNAITVAVQHNQADILDLFVENDFLNDGVYFNDMAETVILSQRDDLYQKFLANTHRRLQSKTQWIACSRYESLLCGTVKNGTADMFRETLTYLKRNNLSDLLKKKQGAFTLGAFLLGEAIDRDDPDKIHSLIQTGVSPDEGLFKIPPVQYALQHKKALQYLLDANIQTDQQLGNNCCRIMARHNWVEELKIFLNHKRFKGQKFDFLEEAVKNSQNAEILKQALESSRSLVSRDIVKEAYHILMQRDELSKLKILLDYAERKRQKFNFLREAVMSDDIEIMKCALDYPYVVINRIIGEECCQTLAQTGKVKKLKTFLAHKKMKDFKFDFLKEAMLSLDDEMIAFALTHPRSLILQTKLDDMLGLAVNRGDLKTTQLLLQHGANANVQYPDGGKTQTPLLVAVRDGHVAIVETLLKYGADPMHKNETGETATTLALSEGRWLSIKQLWIVYQLFKGQQKRKVSKNNQLVAYQHRLDRQKQHIRGQ